MCGDWKIESYYRSAPDGGMDYVCGQEVWKDLLSLCLSDKETQEWFFLQETWFFLLEGHAGCGKTYMAKALATELEKKDYQYIHLNGNSLKGSCEEEGKLRIQRLRQELLSGQKLFLLMERPEKIESMNVLNELTECMDEVKERDLPVVITAVTQETDKIWQPLKNLFIRCRIGLPDSSARLQYFHMFWEESFLKSGAFDIAEFSSLMEGWSFAQLERFRLCVEARMRRVGLNKYGSIGAVRKAVESGAFEVEGKGIFETIFFVFSYMQEVVEAEREPIVSVEISAPRSLASEKKDLKQETARKQALEQEKEKKPEAQDDVMEDLSYLDPDNIDWGF